jgi:hypothetical protein
MSDGVNDVNTMPSQFRVFKKRSAMRLQLDKPSRADQKYDVGCLYLQAAPANGGNGTENGYAWEESKISVKVGFNDISAILHGIKMGKEVNLYHTFNEDSKVIKFTPKEGGGYFLSIEQTRNGEKNSVSVPLSDEEIGSFATMLSFSLPLIHNWI